MLTVCCLLQSHRHITHCEKEAGGQKPNQTNISNNKAVSWFMQHLEEGLRDYYYLLLLLFGWGWSKVVSEDHLADETSTHG